MFRRNESLSSFGGNLIMLDYIIEENKGLIYKIAQSFYGIDKEDLYQAGILGLLKAYRNYHENATTKFSSYAYEYIYGEMYNLVNSKNFKVNKSIRKISRLIEQARDILCQKYGHMPTTKELSSFLNMDSSIIEEALLIPKENYSLDSEEYLMYEHLTGENPNYDNKILLSECLNQLTEDEKNIIISRYYEDLTQDEVARKLKMTQVKVSRYEKKGLNKMHDYLAL